MKIWTNYLDRNMNKIYVGDVLESNGEYGYIDHYDKEIRLFSKYGNINIDKVDFIFYQKIGNINKYKRLIASFYQEIKPDYLDFEVQKEFKQIIKKTKKNVYIWNEIEKGIYTCYYGKYRLLSEIMVFTVQYEEMGRYTPICIKQKQVRKLIKIVKKQEKFFERVL